MRLSRLQQAGVHCSSAVHQPFMYRTSGALVQALCDGNGYTQSSRIAHSKLQGAAAAAGFTRATAVKSKV